MSTKTDRYITWTLGGIVLTIAAGAFYMSTQTKPADVYKLIESKDHIRESLAVFEYSIIEADFDQNITAWDEVAAAWWGYTSAEALAMTVQDLMSAESVPAHDKKYKEAVQRGSGTAVFPKCKQAQHKEGYLFEVQLELRVLPEKQRILALMKRPNG